MNIDISNFYSDNLSNKASSILIPSPNLQDSFMSSLNTERQQSEVNTCYIQLHFLTMYIGGEQDPFWSYTE